MSDDPQAATHEQPANGAWPGAGEPEPIEEEYRAAEWHYDPAAYDANGDPAEYDQADPGAAGDDPASLPVAAAGAEGWPPAGPAASIAPRPNLRNFGRRPDAEPKDTEGKILAVSAQLQELLARRQEEIETNFNASANHSGKRTGFKPATGSQGGSRLPVAPPISLPVRALRPPKGSNWPGLGRSKSNWGKPVGLLLLGAAIAAGAFLVGKASAPAPTSTGGGGRPVATSVNVPAIEPGVWTDAQVKQLDLALAADRGGQVQDAYKLATALAGQAKTASGLRAYLANLESRRGSSADAEGVLAGTADMSTAAGKAQMGFVTARERNFEKTSDWLARAILADPFSLANFYNLGESLRRKGQLADATVRLDEALLRIPAEPEFEEVREVVNLKMRLAQIENGRKAEVQPNLDVQIKQASVSGCWCLTAAALALQDGDLTQAASWLSRARTKLGPDRFDMLFGDYFFRVFSDRAEIAPFYAAASAARQRSAISATTYFIDP